MKIPEDGQNVWELEAGGGRANLSLPIERSLGQRHWKALR